MSPLRNIIKTWWPLAASWLLMSAEGPAISAVISRLPEAAINLAAWGGIIFPLALIIEAPVIMLLPAAAALSKDWASYRRLAQYMFVSGAVLTVLHLLVALTPLYYVVVEDLIGAPPEIVEPARLGFLLMTPWTWAIAYRRFNQGTLIRFGHSQPVGIGTVIRLTADTVVLAGGFVLAQALGPGRLPGAAVAGAALGLGVVCEAVYAGSAVRPVLQREVRPAPRVEPELTWPAFFTFYIPLMLTSLLTLIANPIGSAAISRMPQSIASLAAWQVAGGLVFLIRSGGIAYNEVVVTLLDKQHYYLALRRFTSILVWGSTIVIVLMAATPLSGLWFDRLMGLTPDLSLLARQALWFLLPLPGLVVLQSWFQGAILYGRRTRGVTESVVIFLLVNGVILSLGVALNRFTGIYVGAISVVVSTIAQTAWLFLRARPVLASAARRDLAAQAGMATPSPLPEQPTD